MNYKTLTISELKKFCKNNNIKGYSGKKKQNIITLIENNITMPDILQNNNTTSQWIDKYNQDVLKEQYLLHKTYVLERKETINKVGLKIRYPGIPEDISENIIKFIIQNKLNDKSILWECKSGDLHSKIDGNL
jgi:hypothetical protein